ncbi:MAG: hypothetical protein WC928_03240 [Patescibacteria group bacterium]|jgi:hypothetical protein
MNKVYKIILIFLLLILFVANIIFFVYDSQFMSLFKIESEIEDPQVLINESAEEIKTDLSGQTFFDLEIFSDPKFNKLKDFKVDLKDFALPDELLLSDDISTDPLDGENGSGEVILEPEFDIGNPNPFSPQF